jgi:broad specificity phosphatase PhoE
MNNNTSVEQQMRDRQNDSSIDFTKLDNVGLDERVQQWCSHLSIPDIILVSPYQRCRDSANILATILFRMYQIHVPVQIEPRIARRVDQSINQNHPAPVIQPITYNHLLPMPVDTTEFNTRCAEFLNQLRSFKNVWCVTHSSFMVTLLDGLHAAHHLQQSGRISVDEGILMHGKTTKMGEHIPQYIKAWGAIQILL